MNKKIFHFIKSTNISYKSNVILQKKTGWPYCQEMVTDSAGSSKNSATSPSNRSMYFVFTGIFNSIVQQSRLNLKIKTNQL